MLYNTLHNRALRLGLAVAGELITAAGINLFIVPLGLYSGGTLGVCQLIRTFLQSQLGLDFGTYDIAGALYLITTIPILIFSWGKLGRNVSVGRFSILFNAVLYTICLIVFNPEVAIYSVVYNFLTSIVLDRMHQQNVTVQALIFTREDESVLADFIIKQVGRSVTYWNGVGAYTKDNVHVLCVCLSKYEIEELLHMVHSADPHAFVTVQEGVRIFGNFPRKLE